MGFFSGILEGVGSLLGMPGVGSAVSAGLNLLGGNEQNDSNQQIAAGNNEFNAAQAQANREFQWSTAQWANWNNINNAEVNRNWQEQMSNTQYQRAVGDMKEAGLNPMLAYSQGGAGTPSGATASGAASPAGSAASAAGNPRMENVATAALTAAAQAAQVQNMQKQGENIDADTQLKQAQTANTETQTTNAKTQIEYTLENLRAQASLTGQQQLTEIQKARVEEARVYLTRIQTKLEEGRISQTEAQTALTRVNTQLQKYEIPGAKNQADYQSKEMPSKISPALNDIGKIVNSAGQLRRMGQ